jgi:hypothetical protein
MIIFNIFMIVLCVFLLMLLFYDMGRRRGHREGVAEGSLRKEADRERDFVRKLCLEGGRVEFYNDPHRMYTVVELIAGARK